MTYLNSEIPEPPPEPAPLTMDDLARMLIDLHYVLMGLAAALGPEGTLQRIVSYVDGCRKAEREHGKP